MNRLFRAILRLYPAEYRAVFAPEMIEVFEEASAAWKTRGLFALIWFANCECLGLFKGAVLEHTARWAARDRYITARCASRSLNNQDDISEGRCHLEHVLRSMEFAIAHHDFPKARFYSNEERITRAHLQCLVDKNKPVEHPSI
jgi:hypothetical protein